MSLLNHSIELPSPDHTARLAVQIGARLVAGDCILLAGPVGAGKTHFARHLIQSLSDHPEDVPSPTFTLVQTYHTRAGELWHADLYRLTSPAEMQELGLTEAFGQAICVVEWPDILGSLTPQDALRLTLVTDPAKEDTRLAVFEWTAGKWQAILERIEIDDR